MPIGSRFLVQIRISSDVGEGFGEGLSSACLHVLKAPANPVQGLILVSDAGLEELEGLAHDFLTGGEAPALDLRSHEGLPLFCQTDIHRPVVPRDGAKVGPEGRPRANRIGSELAVDDDPRLRPGVVAELLVDLERGGAVDDELVHGRGELVVAGEHLVEGDDLAGMGGHPAH